MTQPANRRLATEQHVADVAATKVNSSTYTAGLSGKQDETTLAADTAAHVSDGSVLDVALKGTFAARPVTVDDLTYPLVIAHRGGSLLAPENTLEAFQLAYDLGCQASEGGDVYDLTGGGLGVMHDGTIDRTSSGTGNTQSQSAMSWRALTVDSSSWFGLGYADLKPPTFQDVLQHFGGRQILAPEAKVATAAPGMIEAVAKAGLKRSVILSSFNFATCQQFVAAGIPAMLGMSSGTEKTPAEVAAAGIGWITVDYTAVAMTSTLIGQFHAAGVKVIGYTINRQSLATEWLAKGGDGYFSDDPIWTAGRQSGYPYLKTSADFSLGRPYHGHQAGISDRGRFFTSPAGFGWADTTNAGARTVLAGRISPAKGDPNANSYTVDATVYLESMADTGRWPGLFICQDNDLPFKDNGTGATVDGYRCLINGNGLLEVRQYTDGVAVATLASVAGTALTFPLTLQLRVTVTPTTITWQRLDVATTTGAIADSTHRGGYIHYAMSGCTGRFTSVAVS